MCVRLAWTDCDEAGDYVVPNVLSPRDLVSRPDNMNETVLHTTTESKELHLLSNRQFVSHIVRQSHFYAYIVACWVFPLCLVLRLKETRFSLYGLGGLPSLLSINSPDIIAHIKGLSYLSDYMVIRAPLGVAF